MNCTPVERAYQKAPGSVAEAEGARRPCKQFDETCKGFQKTLQDWAHLGVPRGQNAQGFNNLPCDRRWHGGCSFPGRVGYEDGRL